MDIFLSFEANKSKIQEETKFSVADDENGKQIQVSDKFFRMEYYNWNKYGRGTIKGNNELC